MKRNRISSLAAALIMLAVFASVSDAGSGKGRNAEFTGRVIEVGEAYVELKRGPKELKLAYTDATKIFAVDGTEAGRDAIELCQTVKAVYRPVDHAGELMSLTILKEGNCRK